MNSLGTWKDATLIMNRHFIWMIEATLDEEAQPYQYILKSNEGKKKKPLAAYKSQLQYSVWRVHVALSLQPSINDGTSSDVHLKP